jgi:hypothetical protein
MSKVTLTVILEYLYDIQMFFILLFRNQSLFYLHELYLDLISGLHYQIGVIIITSKVHLNQVYLHPANQKAR